MEEAPVNASSRPLGSLPKLRVLVVEDEVLIGMLLEDSLDQLGCELRGPYRSLAEGLAAAERGDYDVALIDFNLDGEKATPLAERLVELGRPFAIASGGGADVTGHGEAAQLHKPFRVEDVAAVLRALIGWTAVG